LNWIPEIPGVVIWLIWLQLFPFGTCYDHERLRSLDLDLDLGLGLNWDWDSIGMYPWQHLFLLPFDHVR